MGFSFVEPKQISKTLEITLSTFKSVKPPEKADFLAQDNQQGSGTLDKKAIPKTTEVAPFQDNSINQVTPPPPARQEVTEAAPKAVVTTVAPKPKKAVIKHEQVKTEVAPQEQAPTFDSSQLTSDIASLEAELAKEQQLYAKRPRIHRLSAASTMRDKGAWYKDDWRKKVERIGNLNYPEEARRQQIYGNLRLMVSINRDGSLYEVLVLESSGQPLLGPGGAADRAPGGTVSRPLPAICRTSTAWRSSVPGVLPGATSFPATSCRPLLVWHHSTCRSQLAGDSGVEDADDVADVPASSPASRLLQG